MQLLLIQSLIRNIVDFVFPMPIIIYTVTIILPIRPEWRGLRNYIYVLIVQILIIRWMCVMGLRENCIALVNIVVVRNMLPLCAQNMKKIASPCMPVLVPI